MKYGQTLIGIDVLKTENANGARTNTFLHYAAQWADARRLFAILKLLKTVIITVFECLR
jgi:hypothetical protein